MQCSPQCVHTKPVMQKQGDVHQHVCTAGAWRSLDRQALEGCLGVVALALGVVMAGTGHLPTLKLLRGGSAFLNTSLLPLLAPIVASHSPPPLPNPKPPNCLPILCHAQCTLLSFPPHSSASSFSSFSLSIFSLSHLMSLRPVSFVLACIHSACNWTLSTCIAYPERMRHMQGCAEGCRAQPLSW